MIEGVVPHSTEMSVEKNYVDSHGLSDAALAFCHLLGFEPLPRLKGISKKKLYRPETGQPDDYANLQNLHSSHQLRFDCLALRREGEIHHCFATRNGRR